MKKIYSIIAIASLMLTSVFSFTSCQKDEMPATMAKSQTVQAQKQGQQSTTTNNSQNANNTTSKTNAANDLGDPFKGLSGTWEYVDEDGIKCTLELTKEEKSVLSQSHHTDDGKLYVLETEYEAKVTAGDKTYSGLFYSGVFLTENNATSYNINALKYISSATATTLKADIKVNGKITAQGITLTKVK